MITDTHFYHGSIKKVITVFGTLFNNIRVSKVDSGKMKNITRVPLAYGPRQRYLTRANKNEGDGEVAIQLPRMSFEITSLLPDTTSKLNQLNQTLIRDVDTGTAKRIWQSAAYKMNISLNIIGRNQDDVLQILEQILPYFNPDYTITVLGMEGPGSKTDLPIVLMSTAIQDDYEGEFEGSRRTILYTLDFEVRVKFVGDTNQKSSYIKWIDVSLIDDPGPDRIGGVKVELTNPETDTPQNYTVTTTYGFL